METEREVRIGIVGSGFVCRQFVQSLKRIRGFRPSAIHTRRNVASIQDFPAQDLLTNSVQELIDKSDVVFECSGDALHATDVITRIEPTDKPVITLNTEFHLVAGSHFADRMLLTEAEGDQPGSLAALGEEAMEMGFEPLVYCNMKGFLNHNPTPEEMKYWAAKNGISVPMVTSFTDGTKLQQEQALVANGCGTTIANPGLVGPADNDFRAAGADLARQAEKIGCPISDYVLSNTASHGVFIVARHDHLQSESLRYLKMGDGPYYYILKPNVLVHLEVIKTIRRIVEGRGVLLNNSSNPTVTVVAIAKHALKRGARLERGVGSFDVRGEALKMEMAGGYVPIPLLDGAIIRRQVETGQILSFDDVELPESRALELNRSIMASILVPSHADANPGLRSLSQHPHCPPR